MGFVEISLKRKNATANCLAYKNLTVEQLLNNAEAQNNHLKNKEKYGEMKSLYQHAARNINGSVECQCFHLFGKGATFHLS